MKEPGYLLLAMAVLALLQACSSSDGEYEATWGWGVAVKDLDGDGHVDIVFTTHDTSPERDQALVFFNRSGGRGKFALEQRLDLHRSGNWGLPLDVFLDDLNNDGLADIAVSVGTSINIAMQDTSTPGNFSSPRQIRAGTFQHDILAIADLNNDGNKDLAVGIDERLAIYFQDSLNPGVFLPPIDLGHSHVSTAAVGDLDGDLLNDIALIDFSADSIKILRQDPGVPGTFTLMQEFGNGSHFYTLRIAELDGDGRLDLAIIYVGDLSRHNDDGLSLRLQDPANPGEFLPARNYLTNAVLSNDILEIGDLNNDGLPDIVVTDSGTDNDFPVYGLFQDAANPGHFVGPREIDDAVLFSIAIADMDGDLLNDLVSADVELNIRYQRGGAPGTFTSAVEIYDPD